MIVLHLFNAGPFDVDTIVYMNFSMKLRRNPFIFLKRKLVSPVPGILFSILKLFFKLIKGISPTKHILK